MCVTGISMMIYRLHGADFDKVIARIGLTVNQDNRVFGEEVFWLGNGHYRYGPYPVDASEVPLRQTIDMIRKYDFDYVIRSAWLFNTSHGVASPPCYMPSFRPSIIIDEVCKQFGTKVDEFRDPYFGPFEIYKLDWDISYKGEDYKSELN